MSRRRSATTAILLFWLNGCASATPTAPPTEAAPIVVRPTVRGPLYPSNAVMDELLGDGLAPNGPTWRYIHDDFANKCGQERDAGVPCVPPTAN